MVLICGNSTLMVRAAQMVLTCKRSSDATPGGNANWNGWAATGAFAANAANDSASAGLAVRGALAAGGAGAAAVTFGGSTQHGGLVPWAQTMATETTSEAANANQRPLPLANTSLPTNSTLECRVRRVWQSSVSICGSEPQVGSLQAWQ